MPRFVRPAPFVLWRWVEVEVASPSNQRGGVVWISRRAHNPEIDGSNPSLATNQPYS